ncbi:jg24195 [Pararge aegeria aegeria]|uniref:Jg24195 protein n=1 Tax=Pararge aegeria aegeria TaxID=348720 RepID=A0A8S4QWP9_9NEOP|nr:jg24195 [Pararge aegeria aegeria]
MHFVRSKDFNATQNQGPVLQLTTLSSSCRGIEISRSQDLKQELGYLLQKTPIKILDLTRDAGVPRCWYIHSVSGVLDYMVGRHTIIQRELDANGTRPCNLELLGNYGEQWMPIG